MMMKNLILASGSPRRKELLSLYTTDFTICVSDFDESLVTAPTPAQLVEKLAPLADLYVCDAFAAAHRDQPSLCGFEQVLPSCMGRLFEQEFCTVSQVMEAPDRPCVFVLGGVFGLFLKLLLNNRSTDNRLIVSVALLFAFCGICALFDVSPLLGCMSMGTVYINVTNDDKLFKQLNYFSPPLLLLFFVRSGLSFDLGALFNPSDAVGTVPLAVIGVAYFLTRILGKYAGAFFGCAAVKKPKEVRNYLGLALIPQAGVAIGLAALGARTLGGTHGAALETVILASSVLYELIGPPCAKLSLYLSKSYSTKLEDIVPLDEETAENGVPKTQLELLIERIQKIQEELPPHLDSEEEKAFTSAAEEQYNAAFPQRKRQAGRW